MLLWRSHLFQGHPCIFQQRNTPHSAHVTKAWLKEKRVQVLDCENNTTATTSFSFLTMCLQEEWGKLKHFISQNPLFHLLRVVTVIKALLSTFLECVTEVKCIAGSILTNERKLTGGLYRLQRKKSPKDGRGTLDIHFPYTPNFYWFGGCNIIPEAFFVCTALMVFD